MQKKPQLPKPLVRKSSWRFRAWRSVRNAFFSGVAIVAPVLVTVWLIVTVVGLINGALLGLLPGQWAESLSAIPGLGIALALVLILIVGALTANYLGRVLVAETEDFVNKVPLVRTIYGGAKQLMQQVTNRDRTSFKEAVLVEFPGPGLYSIGFVTNEEGGDVLDGHGEVAAVFIPLAPIPTTGYLLYVPRAALKPYPLGAEDALKRVLSLGAMHIDASGGVQVAPNALPKP